MAYLANAMLDPVGLLLLPQYPPHPYIPPKLLRRMLRSRIWQKYQSGHFCFDAAIHLLAQLPFVSHSWTAGDITAVLQNRTLKPVSWTLQLLDGLRERLHLRLFCVCNASAEELLALQAQFPALFAKFDATITSGELGFVRPSLHFFKAALTKAHVHSQDSFYLDCCDSFESTAAARSLGMHTLLLQTAQMDNWNAVSPSDALVNDIQVRFSSAPARHLLQFLSMYFPMLLADVRNMTAHDCSSEVSKIKEDVPQNILDGKIYTSMPAMPRPILTLQGRSRALAHGWRYLLETGAHDPKKPFQNLTLTSDGIRILDNFTQFIIADVLNDDRFLPMQFAPVHGLICFMDRSSYLHNNDMGKGANMRYYMSDMFTLEDIPDDLDATSIGLSVLMKFGKVGLDTINRALDTMLEYKSEDDGIFQVYFDIERPRIDPVVVANVVFLFHLANRGGEAQKSESFLESVLLHRAYEEGTLYYILPEAFLWCLARMVHMFKEHFEKRRPSMRALLAERLREGKQRQERESNMVALALAMRMRACSLCGLNDDIDDDDVDDDALCAREELMRMQRTDGSWQCQPFYRYGSNAQSSFTNEALSTAFALAALTD